MAIDQTTVDTWLEEVLAGDVDAAAMLCDSHPQDAVAFTFVDHDLNVEKLTYGQLEERSRKLAGHFKAQGIGEGDRVGVLLTKREELVVTLVALVRLGAVYIPLFTAFATPAVEMRMKASDAKLVVTEDSQLFKVEPLGLPIFMAGEEYQRALETAEPVTENYLAAPDHPFLQLYTSGTTGAPKGVPVPVRALAAFKTYMRISLDVRDDDVFWNAADPGWAYGLYYGVVGPLAIGVPNILYTGKAGPEDTLHGLTDLGVTNFAGAPTLYRTLAKADTDQKANLRRASSAGEPLTADILAWSPDALGCEVRDQYGQTELGMVICSHWADGYRQPVKKGSMGRPMPGIVADVIEGVIAIDTQNSPNFWFMGYHNEPERTAVRYSDDGRWYLTGDLGRIDEDGDVFFASRDDDLILMAGYRISPFDVESVLVEHDSVADVAVVGRPDPEGVRGEIAEAFIVLRSGWTGGDELAKELQQAVREGYSAHAYPRRFHFVDELPKTPSGKTQRYKLKEYEG